MVSSASDEAQLDALHTAIGRLTSADSEQEICDIVIDSVSSVFGVESAGLWLYDDEKEVLRLTVTNDARMSDRDVVERSGNGLLWNVFTDGSIVTDPDIDNGKTVSSGDSPFENELLLSVGDSAVLRIGSFDAVVFDERDRQVAKILATNVEAALDKQEREHELRVKNERLEEFISIISHDLRNPLSVADGNIELVRAGRDDERLRKASSAVDRIEGLIDDLMTLAEQGFVVTDREELDLEALARSAWSNVHSPSATLQTAGSMTVYGEEIRLLQAFENLFRNAVEHAGEDVTVRVGPIEPLSTSTRGPNSDGTRGFYIEDDGPGIRESAYADVFESGFSAEGTGLGLSIVHRIVVAHGWETTCRDPVQSGARFEITDGVKPVNPLVAR